MNYSELLKYSYAVERARSECPPESPLEYLGESIFDFTTYDGKMSELFAAQAIEVCDAISAGATFDYIKNAHNYRWYLLMVNMPFFVPKIEWGGSVRGAWWQHDIRFSSCGLWCGDDQISDELRFTQEAWKGFMEAVSNFSRNK